jgi:hypothetical protein
MGLAVCERMNELVDDWMVGSDQFHQLPAAAGRLPVDSCPLPDKLRGLLKQICRRRFAPALHVVVDVLDWTRSFVPAVRLYYRFYLSYSWCDFICFWFCRQTIY